ncbi:MAG: FKBP-type peptidyl-prolyl cis-trans isomerase [Candidatus Peribacteria bacterium]|nr:MAG: FKBP-type peptidyl-prolyl cis-trans isomerase [Candidatus Peribacteria bacterium]
MIGTTLLVAACNTQDNQTVTNDPALVDTGDLVTVDYTVMWSDGDVFATNVSGTEITALGTDSLERNIGSTVTAGDDNVIWSDTVIGKKVGDTVTMTVDPQTSGEEQYYDIHQVQDIVASAFGAAITPTIGDVYDIGGQRAWITALSGSGGDQVITFDRNPRETWDDYTYEVTITNLVNQ